MDVSHRFVFVCYFNLMIDDIFKLLKPWISDSLVGNIIKTIGAIIILIGLFTWLHPKKKSLIKFEKFSIENLKKSIRGIIISFIGLAIFYFINRFIKSCN